MKHLYPNLSLLAYTRLALLTLFLTGNTVAFSQTLNFNAPVLESGTANQAGSLYRFKSVTSGGLIDALVKVDSLIGVSLSSIDATPSGTSTTAFQPQLSSSGGIGYHYAVFTVSFVTTGTSTPNSIFNFSNIFMGIDGSNQITEFNSITVANASWKYLSATPNVSVTQNGNTYSGTATNSNPSGGQGIDDRDSTQMLKVSAASLTSFTMRVGYYQQQNGWNGNDLFGMNISGSELQAAILPVDLLSFTAKLTDDKVLLSWSTSKEENMSHYIIERSYDKNSYDQVALIFTAEVPAAVNNYSYKDAIKNAAAAVIYYRLKMVDKGGSYKYSDVRTVSPGHDEKVNESARITTYPNPVVNDLRITMPANWQNKTVNCQLLNINGQIIKSFTIQQAGSTATISMSQVAPGTYFVKAISGKEISTQTVVKSGTY